MPSASAVQNAGGDDRSQEAASVDDLKFQIQMLTAERDSALAELERVSKGKHDELVNSLTTARVQAGSAVDYFGILQSEARFNLDIGRVQAMTVQDKVMFMAHACSDVIDTSTKACKEELEGDDALPTSLLQSTGAQSALAAGREEADMRCLRDGTRVKECLRLAECGDLLGSLDQLAVLIENAFTEREDTAARAARAEAELGSRVRRSMAGQRARQALEEEYLELARQAQVAVGAGLEAGDRKGKAKRSWIAQVMKRVGKEGKEAAKLRFRVNQLCGVTAQLMDQMEELLTANDKNASTEFSAQRNHLMDLLKVARLEAAEEGQSDQQEAESDS